MLTLPTWVGRAGQDAAAEGAAKAMHLRDKDLRTLSFRIYDPSVETSEQRHPGGSCEGDSALGGRSHAAGTLTDASWVREFERPLFPGGSLLNSLGIVNWTTSGTIQTCAR